LLATGLPLLATGLPLLATGLPLLATGLPLLATGFALLATGLALLATGLPLLATGLPLLATGFALLATGLPLLATGLPLLATGFALLATGFALLATGFALLATGLPLLATGFALLATGFALLTTGLPLLATGFALLTTGLPLLATGLPLLATGFALLAAKPSRRGAKKQGGNKMADIIPRRESELITWADNFATWVGEYAGDLDIPAAEVNKLKIAVNFFKSTHEQAAGPDRTPVIITTKNEAKRDMIAKIRAMVRFRLQNPAVTDAMRVQLGLRVPDSVRTEHTVVNELVEFELGLRGIREIVVNFWIKGADHRAKPAGYDGAVLVWDTPDAPPERPADLGEHTMASRTPHIIEFDDTRRGKTAYIALCWQNERGIRGPWSEVQSAVVP
jgi:hypothetical protein